MKLEKIALISLTAFILSTSFVFAESEKEKDFAVPAFSDFQALGAPIAKLNPDLPKEQLNPLPVVGQMRWLDLNQDQQFNDFDAKQFQAIVENLRGEKLTGLELQIRFRTEQKNQKESFPLLYDLDRDGMFTSFDVDAFASTISNLDEGATMGSDLVQKFKLQLFPQEKK